MEREIQSQPDEEQIEKLLQSYQPSPSERFYRRMAGASWQDIRFPRQGRPMSAPAKIAFLSLAVLLLAAAGLAFSSQGQALAKQLLRFFTPAKSVSFPIPAAQLTTQARALVEEFNRKATFVPELKSTHTPELSAAFQPGSTSTSPDANSKALLGCIAGSYKCQISKAEAESGFDAKELAAEPPGLTFDSAQTISGSQPAFVIRYLAISGGGELSLTQGFGDFPAYSEWAAVPAEVVLAVMVGEFPGEYVEGMFVNRAGSDSATWEQDAPAQRLRWKEGDRWFELAKMGDPEPIEYLDRDGLIDLAKSLILQPNDEQVQLNPDFLANVGDGEKLAGFDLKEPAVLPQSFVFTYAQYDTEQQSVKLVYELNGKSGTAGIVIIQTPLAAATKTNPKPEDYPPGAIQSVRIGSAMGTYLAGSWWGAPASEGTPTPGPMPTLTWRPDDPTRSLAWESDGLSIQILFFASPYYSGRLEKEEMIRIAESMQ